MSDATIIKGGTVITVDGQDRIREADLVVSDGRIMRIVDRIAPGGGGGVESGYGERQRLADFSHLGRPPVFQVIDARGCAVIPGFVQTHVHLCQTVMRGHADDLRLLDWLRQRVWPMEAAHTRESLFASARLGIAEMVKGGTTAALTMETVRHTEAAFRAVEQAGFRAVVGKCMMDKGEDLPPALIEDARASIEESLDLLEEWDGKGDGRIRFAFAPRFAVSCTPDLLTSVADLARERKVMIHTHASESREEIALVRAETGRENIEYLHSLGLTGPRTVLAHCVWATDQEMKLLGETGTGVAHCPSSNLKLGSGIARVSEMIGQGIKVSLGADGAPCNNRLDMFTEMRTASLLQKVRLGPESLPARAALRMATIEGARALGLEGEVGSIEEGKRADLAVVNLSRLHLTPHPDPISTLVFAGERSDVETVLIDGRVVMRGGRLSLLNEEDVIAEAREESLKLAARAGLA
ncbi:MAG TPA: 5'-deoxyadenosine deaminase [Blastocatellia bacterium]|nr:5'-deoxyadenosine deaminase [Blastocatellia bacterium]